MTNYDDTDNNTELLATLARRNWIIFVVLVVLSLPVHDKQLTLGVVSGGLIAICGYQWLYNSLVKTLTAPGDAAVKAFRLSYFFRLAALVVMLMLLVAVVKVNALGLIIGLSVVVINIMYTTIKHAFFK